MARETLREGIIVGKELLTKEEFEKWFIENINLEEFVKDGTELKRKINNDIKSVKYKNIQLHWESFKRKYLNGGNLTGLIIVNKLSDAGWEDIVKIEDETLVQNKKTGAIDTTLMDKAINNTTKLFENNREILKHWQDLLSTLNNPLSESAIQEGYKISKENNYSYVYQSGKSGGLTLKGRLKNTYGEGKNRINNPDSEFDNYNWILYGRKKKFTRQGQEMDSFITHLGEKHGNLFGNELKGMSMRKWIGAGGEYSAANFFRLMFNGTNTTEWYKGGDLTLVDSNGNIIVNVQLKTTQNMEAKWQAVAYKNLLGSLNEIFISYKKINTYNVKDLANKFYESFKTQAIVSYSVDKLVNIK